MDRHRMQQTLSGRATPRERRRDMAAGARAMAPWLVGIVPYGLVIGVSAARSDVPTVAAWLTAPLIFAGSAQVAVIDLLGSGAAPVVVIVAALAINLRLVLYSATMAPYWRDTSRWWRALAAYLLTDPSLAVGLDGYARTSDRRRGHRFYLGAGVCLWVAWLTAIGVGAAVGARLPGALHLEFVIPIFLAGEVASRLTNRPARHAAAASVVVALLAVAAPLQLGPLLAICVGIAAGLRAEGGDR
jgi:predicted branched-subunit amino acid permease